MVSLLFAVWDNGASDWERIGCISIDDSQNGMQQQQQQQQQQWGKYYGRNKTYCNVCRAQAQCTVYEYITHERSFLEKEIQINLALQTVSYRA